MANKIVLKGIEEKTVVHIPTRELAKEVCEIAGKAGIKTLHREEYSVERHWAQRDGKTCFWFSAGIVHSIDYFKSENHPVLDAKEFIRLNQQPTVPNVQLTPEQYSFNLDRLATEADKLFKKQLTDANQVFKGEAKESSIEVLNEMKTEVARIAESIEDDFLHRVRETVANEKEMLLEELRKGRSIFNVNSGEDVRQISISTDDHYMMEQVFKSILLHKKIMLAGEAGTGKTYMGYGIAKKLNLPFYKYSCSRDSSVHDLMGYKQPASENYLQTTFLNAYENGGVFLVDEYDAMPGDVALFFNGVADSSKSITIPHRDTNPIAKKHKDFYLIMCGNTWGKGSQDYSGRDFQDKALLDRFRLCRHHIGYDERLEKSMVGEDIYPFITNLRSGMTNIGSYLSTRNVEDIAILLKSGENLDYIMKTICEDLEELDKKQITGLNLAYKFSTNFQSFTQKRNVALANS